MSDISCKQQIINKTVAGLQGFVSELALGNTKYRSLHNLTEQVEQQYHERFIVELIQNAHDALLPPQKVVENRRIEIRIQADDGPNGALYIANDGLPFSPSNFKSLSELGQSDKDPKNSIGNKGIGFRSVLEISDSPEIYSREKTENQYFDGFCFRFFPGIIQEFEKPIQKLLDGEKDTLCTYSEKEKLLPGGDDLYNKLLDHCRDKQTGWLNDEIKYLSPYLFPVPIDNPTDLIKHYEINGFATIIRLPFSDKKAYQLALKKIKELPDDMILFLDRIETLKLVTEDHTRVLKRTENERTDDPEQGKEVLLSIQNQWKYSSKDQLRKYWLWQETYGGESNPEEKAAVKEAVQDLPGKWPDLRKTEASFAVRVDDKPEQGCLNIYLPTKMKSGCHAHFSAPFYGDINRTGVDFDQDYNLLLLEILAEKVVKVINNSLAGKGLAEAAAIIDLISPEKNSAAQNWWFHLKLAENDLGVSLKSATLCLTNQGWESFSKTRLLPDTDSHELITDNCLRQHTNVPIINKELLSRKHLISQIYESLDLELTINSDNLSIILESIATSLHKQEKTAWNIFWKETKLLFPNSTPALKNRKLILGTDNYLHASGGTEKVFFRPTRTGQDSEIVQDRRIDEIPKALRPYIAFLHKDIVINLPGDSGRLTSTPVRKYLDENLVLTFGVEDIVRGVLIQNTPRNLPVSYSDSQAALCQAIFQWGLKLAFSLIEQGKGENIVKLLGRLPAPCLGGWYPIKEASFGIGWPGTLGALLDEYLTKMKSPACQEARNKILRPPSDILWESMGLTYKNTLIEAGVFDGLRLSVVKPEEWVSSFNTGSHRAISLPVEPPPGTTREFWLSYKDYISTNFESEFSGSFNYTMHHFFLFPGFQNYKENKKNIGQILTKLILASISNWKHNYGWHNTELKKEVGSPHFFTPSSPLFFFLQTEKWIHNTDGNLHLIFQPSERWYIDSNTLSGRSKQFEHLNPYPAQSRKLLADSPATIEELQKLGMPVYAPNKEVSDPRLLNSLANAVSDPNIEIVNQSVFLGQLRDAWKQFHPDDNSSFPQQVIIKQGKDLAIADASSTDRPFLPDDSPAVHDGLKLANKPIVAIDSKEAKRLQDSFSEFWADGILLASELKMWPVINGKSAEWPKGTGETLNDCNLEWLAPIILSIFAFSGEQSHGTTTKTFKDAIDSIHQLRIHWVDDLALGLWQDDKCITDNPLPQAALKVPKKRIILAQKESKYSPGQLSSVLSSIVDRSILEIPLKFALSQLETIPPAQDNIISSLADLHISKEQFDEVQQLWLGEVSWTIRLLKPILTIINPQIDISSLSEINSSDDLEKFLSDKNLSDFSVTELLAAIRRERSIKGVGHWLYGRIGDEAQLLNYNMVLKKLKLPLVKNDDAMDEFKDHLTDMHLALQAIVRKILIQQKEDGSFLDMMEQLKQVHIPPQLETDTWNVEFNMVAIEVATIFEAIGASEQEVNAVRSTHSQIEMEQTLTGLGLSIHEDSLKFHSANCNIFHKKLLLLQSIAAAWCVQNHVTFTPWANQINSKLEQRSDLLDPAGYLKLWDEKRCFSAIKKIYFPAMPEEFKNIFLQAVDVNLLPELLGISKDDIKSADKDLEDQKRTEEKKKRLVTIGGKEFDSSADNLFFLWDHIKDNISSDSISPLHLHRSDQLRNTAQRQSSRNKKTGRRNKNSRGSFPRMSQSMKNILGLTGEIIVYRALEKEFGSSIVNAECWVSENATYKFPGSKDVSDSLGCDFILKVKGKTHYIEVKASLGDHTAFELGSSEVQRAIDVARKSKKEKFIILHVVNALSNSPTIRELPNPYHQTGAKKYNIMNKGLRMTYKIK